MREVLLAAEKSQLTDPAFIKKVAAVKDDLEVAAAATVMHKESDNVHGALQFLEHCARDQLSPRTFCQLGPLVPACSHGRIAEHMSGGSCVPRCSDFRPAPSSCVPCFPGPFSTESRCPGARLPGPTCCLALCIPGSLLHVGLLPGPCLTVVLPAPRSFSQSPCGMSV